MKSSYSFIPLALILAACVTPGGHFSSKAQVGLLSLVVPEPEVLSGKVSKEQCHFESSTGTVFSLSLSDLENPPKSWAGLRCVVTEIYDPLAMTAMGLALPPGTFAGALNIKIEDQAGLSYALKPGIRIDVKCPVTLGDSDLESWELNKGRWNRGQRMEFSDIQGPNLGPLVPGLYKEGPQRWSGWLVSPQGGTREIGNRHPFTGVLIAPFKITAGPSGEVMNHRSLSAYSGDPVDSLVELEPGAEVLYENDRELKVLKGNIHIVVTSRENDLRILHFPDGGARFTRGVFSITSGPGKKTQIEAAAGCLEVLWADGKTQVLGPGTKALTPVQKALLTRGIIKPWFLRQGQSPRLLLDQGFGGNALILDRLSFFSPSVRFQVESLNQWMAWSRPGERTVHNYLGAPIRDLDFMQPLKEALP